MAETIELKRVKALDSYNIIYTDSEKEYDELTLLAATICNSPVSLINFIDEHEQWSKSVYGIAKNYRRVPRSQTICQYAIQKNDLFEVPDLSADERFKEIPYIKHDPKFRYYLGAPLEDSEGNIIGTLCVLDYIPKTLDAEKKSQLRILANQVMAHLELRKQNEALQKLNQHQVQLMKILSHDLRAPLNGIIGLSELMVLSDEDNFKKDESREIISGINRSAVQLKQMISGILNYALFKTEGINLNREEIDLNESINKAKELYEPLARFKNIELDITGGESIKKIVLDKEKFEQIFGNLLSNSIKYTENGGFVKSTIEVVGHNGSKSLILKVKDNGIGMSEELTEMVLNGEVTGNTNKTIKAESTGIGVTIIKRFVDFFGGTLQIKSKEGEGSEFTVTLPLRES
ncbi:MAG: sensor histidine kinase [Balneolaceae bacterium]|nr:MAG: sensor histidine kinase [Balneolaceae bacterium]